PRLYFISARGATRLHAKRRQREDAHRAASACDGYKFGDGAWTSLRFPQSVPFPPNRTSGCENLPHRGRADWQRRVTWAKVVAEGGVRLVGRTSCERKRSCELYVDTWPPCWSHSALRRWRRQGTRCRGSSNIPTRPAARPKHRHTG